MNNQLSIIALEGTYNGDVVGGFYRGLGKAFRRFCFFNRRKMEIVFDFMHNNAVDLYGYGEKVRAQT